MKKILIGFLLGVFLSSLGLWLIAARPQDINEELARSLYNNFIQRGTEVATTSEMRVRLPVPYANERYQVLLQTCSGTSTLRAYVIDNKSFGVIVIPQMISTQQGGTREMYGPCKFFWVTAGKKLR